MIPIMIKTTTKNVSRKKRGLILINIADTLYKIWRFSLTSFSQRQRLWEDEVNEHLWLTQFYWMWTNWSVLWIEEKSVDQEVEWVKLLHNVAA